MRDGRARDGAGSARHRQPDAAFPVRTRSDRRPLGRDVHVRARRESAALSAEPRPAVRDRSSSTFGANEHDVRIAEIDERALGETPAAIRSANLRAPHRDSNQILGLARHDLRAHDARRRVSNAMRSPSPASSSQRAAQRMPLPHISASVPSALIVRMRTSARSRRLERNDDRRLRSRHGDRRPIARTMPGRSSRTLRRSTITKSLCARASS